jgi:hypothetical protein
MMRKSNVLIIKNVLTETLTQAMSARREWHSGDGGGGRDGDDDDGGDERRC